MLDKNDLKQIKEIIDVSFDDFAIIVNSGFKSVDDRFAKQDRYIEDRFAKQDRYIDDRFAKQDRYIEDKIEEKLIEKLSTIKSELFSIKEEIRRLDEKIGKIFKTLSQDIIAVNNDTQDLKERVLKLEKKIEILQASPV
ncbi:MAG: hypothetical protein U9O66_00235 [Patescibacteria group bacterium]|nr:hypothetical protein [Patescibacteria group bacterium]